MGGILEYLYSANGHRESRISATTERRRTSPNRGRRADLRPERRGPGQRRAAFHPRRHFILEYLYCDR